MPARRWWVVSCSSSHCSTVRWMLLLRSTPTPMLNRVAPNGQSCPLLRKENRHTSALLSKYMRWRSKGDESLGCGTAPKLWPRSQKTEIQGLVGTPLSTPPWLPSTGVPRGSTTESQGMEWMSMGARVSDWDCMLYNLNPLNRRPGHTQTHTFHTKDNHTSRIAAPRVSLLEHDAHHEILELA